MYKVVIHLPQGATIMDDDTQTVRIERHVHTPEQVNDLQKAAIVLGAAKVEIDKNER